MSGGLEGSGLFTRKVTSVGEFEVTVRDAVSAVEARKGAFVEAILQRK